MENTTWDRDHDAAPQDNWQTDQENAFNDDAAITNNELQSAGAYSYDTDEDINKSIYAIGLNDDPDDEDEDDDEDDEDNEDDEDEDDESGDWGHVDPAEGNSPIPDGMDPSGPGSAV